MKYTVNIPQDIREPQEVNHSLSNMLLAVLELLEQKGLKFSPSMGIKITPEILEKLLIGDIATEEPVVFSKNKAMNAFSRQSRI